MTSTDNAVTIERTFSAPIDKVWSMWAESEHFASWYGPQGATIPVAEMDVREGGTRKIGMQMQTPQGEMTMFFVGEYLAVEPPHRLVYTEAMADADGNVMSPEQMGMPEGHPETTEITVILAEVDGATQMTMTHAGVPADSPGAMGWNMAIDKLTALLES
ncbi:MAG: SRPBCC domain-containing protein [Acidimicrobiales bacterium]|nr:SRPBCC domain-containing protein [Acidimicrobiales bacterium]